MIIQSVKNNNFRGLGGKGVSEGCRLRGTDCGGHSSLFCAIARANSIPARKLPGQVADASPCIIIYLLVTHFIIVLTKIKAWTRAR